MPLNPQESLNKAYRRQKVNRREIETFKSNLSHLLKEINEKESEEHLKNDFTTFLNETWYKGEYLINTKGRTDLAIYNDKTAKSSVGVLLEVKKPGNKSEMISQKHLNAKALQELLLYYLREKHDHANNDIKHLVVTNVYEWFIFDATEFYTLFYKNKKLVKAFREWASGKREGTNTDYFYKEIASAYISEVYDQLNYTWFDLREFEQELTKDKDSKKLISLFKVLSPVHLLKQSFANDSNSLNKQFYHELLHIIGLEEVKDKGKKVIQRKTTEKRIEGSFLENAIMTMDERDRLRGLDRPSHFGNTTEEQLYAVALELCITWINRILFLKLMESQLVTYHKGDQSYRFLDFKTIPNYDALESLFFGVLAKRQDERAARYVEKYAKVPYLNSSLFEPTGLEDVMTVTMLNNNVEHELYSRTVLKDANGKPLSGKMDTLEYLFRFLEAYDFSSEGNEEIQEESKSLINASVLGLIFEKINGYKDGSFYTPGFITMYMCRETIRRAVVQKFNEAKGWSLENFDQLYDKIDDKQEANTIINSLKICDPAVGSGHFLVSALNEIIAIKSELKILLDREGRTLRDYEVTIENDELIVESEGELFQYVIGNKEKHRIQETLFHEKQTIIENCLFGVDINANSVKICRLRLWIELLKNAFYKNETELETLPNIDINIKTGNSLISRFDLDVDISEALKQRKGASIRWDIATYRNAVSNYKNATSKEDKRQFEQLIDTIKGDFETEINKKDKRLIRVNKLKGELFNLTNQQSVFALEGKAKKKWEQEVNTKTSALQKLETELDEIKNNQIYEDAFEWRFEFPEVLDDQGNFIGFDVVIGNPPYVDVKALVDAVAVELFRSYNTTENRINLYAVFIEQGYLLMKSKGILSYIIPNSILVNSSYSKIRKLLIDDLTAIVKLPDGVFEEAIVETIVLEVKKNSNEESVKTLVFSKRDKISFIDNSKVQILSKAYWKSTDTINYNLYLSPDQINVLGQIEKDSVELIELADFTLGITPYDKHKGHSSELIQSRGFHSKLKIDSSYQPLITGENIVRYVIKDNVKEYLKYGEWLGRPREVRFFLEPRILVRQIVSGIPPRIYAGFTDKELYFTHVGFGIIAKEKEFNLILLGILNSKLMNFFHMYSFLDLEKELFQKVLIANCKKFPIKKALLKTDNSDFKLKIEEIIDLKTKDPKADISALETEIDHLVYELYGLTEEEIRIIEESLNGK